MQDYEQNLFISVCLGHELDGDETDTELSQLLETLNSKAAEQPVNPAQEDLAEWLNISLDRCNSRQEASVRMWDRITDRSYSLADVPVKIRRQAFGGSLDIQKRLGRPPLHVRLLRKLGSTLQPLITLAALAAAAWLAFRVFGAP